MEAKLKTICPFCGERVEIMLPIESTHSLFCPFCGKYLSKINSTFKK